MATELGKALKHLQALRHSQDLAMSDVLTYQNSIAAHEQASDRELAEYSGKLQQALASSMDELASIDQAMRSLQILLVKRGIPISQLDSISTFAHYSLNSSIQQEAKKAAAPVAQPNDGDSSIPTSPPVDILSLPSMLPLSLPSGELSLCYVDGQGNLGHVEANQPALLHAVVPAAAAAGRFWELRPASEGTLPVGAQVAAYVDMRESPDDEPEPNWVVARVVSTLQATAKTPVEYVVSDDDVTCPGNPSYRRMLQLRGQTEPAPPPPARSYRTACVLPLPTLAEVPPARRHVFSAGASVLALYPADCCTVFYRATVVKPMRPRKAGGSVYSLRFDEESDEKRVSAKYVLPWAGVDA